MSLSINPLWNNFGLLCNFEKYIFIFNRRILSNNPAHILRQRSIKIFFVQKNIKKVQGRGVSPEK